MDYLEIMVLLSVLLQNRICAFVNKKSLVFFEVIPPPKKVFCPNFEGRFTLRISGLLGFFLVLIAANALGIGAASFASESGFGYGEWEWDSGTDFFERGENKKRAKI